MQGAWLQGTWLGGVNVDSKTNLNAKTSRASAVRFTNYTDCTVEPRFFEEAFGDASVEGLPDGYVPGEPPLGHWARGKLTDKEFYERWRAWQVEIGYRTPDASD
jgi:hypothetical protein